MPAKRKANDRRLTVAGLIAVTAATLLMMGWAIFPSTAGAAPDDVCPGTKVDVDDIGTGVTIDGVVITLVNDTTVNFNIVEGTTVTVCVKAGSENQGDGPEQHTITVDTSFQHSTLKDLSHVSIVSVSTPTTTTDTTTTDTTTTTTTPGGGGGGGGGTTTVPVTTTTSPTVAPTKVEPSTTTRSPNVAPTTVSPRGTAFTGVENVVPIGAIALMLMTSGTGLLWAGSRRKRDQNQDEE